jgi:hypothetical protein
MKKYKGYNQYKVGRGLSLLEQGIAVPALGPSKWSKKSEEEQVVEVQRDLFGDDVVELRKQVWPVDAMEKR